MWAKILTLFVLRHSRSQRRTKVVPAEMLSVSDVVMTNRVRFFGESVPHC